MGGIMRAYLWIAIAFILLIATCPAAEGCELPTQHPIIDVPGHPFAAVPSPDDCWLFVSLDVSKEQGALVILKNTGDGFVTDRVVPLTAPGFGEAMSPDGAMLAVTEGATVEVFDAGRLTRHEAPAVLATLAEGQDAGATYAAMSPDSKLLFVSDEYAKRVSVFDLTKVREGQGRGSPLVGRVPAGLAPVGLAVSPDGRWLYVTSQVGPPVSGGKVCKPENKEAKPHPEGLLLRVNVEALASDASHAIAGVLHAGCNPVRVALSPSGQDLWISARGDDALLRLQPTDWLSDDTHLKLKVYPVGPSPIGVAVRGDGAQVWVAVSDRFEKKGRGVLVGLAYHAGDADDTDVKLMKTDNVEYPREVAFFHDNRTLAVTLFDANKVAIVRTPD
ncbi:YncE family protein [Dyella sp. 20L07]|uniref:YncE family protein n=1 Tax=Dyella sp. 20L07 TaxID=3384240 RepID=UPI003D26B6B1